MKVLSDSTKRALSVFSEVLGESFSAQAKVYLFGSQARGDAKSTSDVDLLLVTQPEIRRLVRLKAAEVVSELLCEGLPYISFMVIDTNHWRQPTPFVSEIKRDAVALQL